MSVTKVDDVGGYAAPAYGNGWVHFSNRTGASGSFYGDASPAHGRFYCGLSIEGVIDQYHWFNGGSIATWSLDHVLCSFVYLI
ncbi:hypothetical protein RQP46_010613 [Phenoliferia psychrophenolica]